MPSAVATSLPTVRLASPDDPTGSIPRWQPFEQVDAGVFFGRDAQIVKALDALRGICVTGRQSLFAILGPAGTAGRRS